MKTFILTLSLSLISILSHAQSYQAVTQNGFSSAEFYGYESITEAFGILEDYLNDSAVADVNGNILGSLRIAVSMTYMNPRGTINSNVAFGVPLEVDRATVGTSAGQPFAEIYTKEGFHPRFSDFPSRGSSSVNWQKSLRKYPGVSFTQWKDKGYWEADMMSDDFAVLHYFRLDMISLPLWLVQSVEATRQSSKD